MRLQLKTIRTRMGLSQTDAALLVSMPVRRYGSYEREERALSLKDACAIADAFGVSLDDLAGRDWSHPLAITIEEQRLVKAYRATDGRGRRAIQYMAAEQVKEASEGNLFEALGDTAN